MSMSISLVDKAATFGAVSGRTRLVHSDSQRPACPKLKVTVLAAALFSGSKLLPMHHRRKVRRARTASQLQDFPRINGNEIPNQSIAPRERSKTVNEEYRSFEDAQDIGAPRHFKQHQQKKQTIPIPLQARKTTPIPLKARKLSSCIEDVKKIMRGEVKAENFIGLSTGFSCMDKFYRPVRGELTVVTAPPGSGKSEWLLSLLINMAQVHDWRFGVCMFEHKREDFDEILMEKFLVAPRTEIRGLEESQTARFWDFLDAYVCFIGKSFSEEMSIQEILEAARYHADNHKDDGGLHGLIIDPYNYITKDLSGLKGARDHEFVALLLREVKQFAAEYNCHVWIVVHPTKNSATARGEQPSLYDCCGSANWYNMIDNGIVLQRNKDPSAGPTNMVKVQVAKVRNRFAGEVGNVTLDFDKNTRCYSETAS